MLTAKQELFVQKIIEGMNQADAYRAAYSSKNMSDKTIHEAASRLVRDSKVAARLAELREQLTKPRGQFRCCFLAPLALVEQYPWGSLSGED